MTTAAIAGGQTLLTDAAERARRYLAGVGQRPVAPGGAALTGLVSFAEPLPDSPQDPAATLALLDAAGSPATVASTGGRYFGFVTGGCLPVALTAARDQQLARAGWDVQADGLFGAPELTVVVGENAHSTLIKALGMVGLGRRRVCRVPADAQGRLRADRLPGDVTGPTVICAQAGEVNTGAFDPFSRGCGVGPAAAGLGARGRRVRALGAGRSIAGAVDHRARRR